MRYLPITKADQRIAVRVYSQVAEIHGNLAQRDMRHADRRDAIFMTHLTQPRGRLTQRMLQAYGKLSITEWDEAIR